MVLTEIFRNYEQEHTDNAECVSCGAGFTIPEIAASRNAPLACPNCGEAQTAKESIDARRESDAHTTDQAPDDSMTDDSEWTAGRSVD